MVLLLRLIDSGLGKKICILKKNEVLYSQCNLQNYKMCSLRSVDVVASKVFIGPRLRSLRLARNLTQTEFARLLNVSASLINLLERNQRSASLAMLMKLSDACQVDIAELTKANTPVTVDQLRKVLHDPAAGQADVSVDELRSAVDLAPSLVEGLVNVFSNYQTLAQRLAESLSGDTGARLSDQASEQRVHEFIHSRGNYFDDLEQASLALRTKLKLDNHFALSTLKTHLKDTQGIAISIVPAEEIFPSVRIYRHETKELLVSDTLDHINKIFQIAHFIAFTEFGSEIDGQLRGVVFDGHQDKTRAQMRLCDYFAAALLMPYSQFLHAAQTWRYDFERLASLFGVTYEQVCQRITTLHRPGEKGVPFFFLRIDKAGNVSKRFNSTSVQHARYGGTCPKLNVHYSFRVPGRILTQEVEMPNGDRFLTINRTVERPSGQFNHDDRRQAVCVGCDIRFAQQLVYGAPNGSQTSHAPTEIGVNCRLCPRPACDQRAHESAVQELPVDADRRGQNRFDN